MDDLRKKAKKRVEAKKGFYIHFGVYAACSIFFVLLNYLTGDGNRGDWWFFYPVLGWGLGVAIHYITIFGIPGTDIFSKSWEDRELQQEIARLHRNQEMETPNSHTPNEELKLGKLELKEKELLKKEWDEDELV